MCMYVCARTCVGMHVWVCISVYIILTYVLHKYRVLQLSNTLTNLKRHIYFKCTLPYEMLSFMFKQNVSDGFK